MRDLAVPDQFRADIASIMAGAPPLKPLDLKDPASRGCLRRPELDRDGLLAWELPNGTIAGMVASRALAEYDAGS
ncbi:hypothetical protein [uncultured Enterovirga sp.]|uniref:hypothetical protein n=1 Tax=uncultured Enterovirga sp. TaxID=2026352 RepID=UPI0035C959FA